MRVLLAAIFLIACSDPPPAPEPTHASTASVVPNVESSDAGPVQIPQTAPLQTAPRPDPPCGPCPLELVSPR